RADVRHRLVPEGAAGRDRRGRSGPPPRHDPFRLLRQVGAVARILPRLHRPVLRVHARVPGRPEAPEAEVTDFPPNATKHLNAHALKAGATVVGIADAAAFDAHAPAKHRPSDLLPGARTVVVVGGAQPRAGDWVATSPWLLSTMGTTERIQGVGRRLAQTIES